MRRCRKNSGWASNESVHLYQLAELPLHHRDPFDRLLIAQAQVEGIVIVTTDSLFPLYAVRIAG